MKEKFYRFSKELIGTQVIDGYGVLYNCKMYKVFNEDKLLGQFFYNDKVCFIGFENFDIRVKIEIHTFKKSEYTIVNNNTEEHIGHYNLPNWTSGGVGKIGEIEIGDEKYSCKMLLPDVCYSILKPSTWGNYKFSVSNDTATVIYNFKTNRNSSDLDHNHLYSFEGNINPFNTDLLIVFTGLYLIEIGLKQEYL